MSAYLQAPVRRSLSAARIAPDRRRYKRVKLQLGGRYMRSDKSEHSAKIIDISAGGAALSAPPGVALGERIVAHFEHLGGVVGHVSRLFPGGFALTFSATKHKREKLAAQITWLINRHELADPTKERKHERVAVSRRITTLKLAENLIIECRILDVSLSGASIGTEARPPVGHVVTVGKQMARVMRYHDQGIGVQFLQPQELEALQRDFG